MGIIAFCPQGHRVKVKEHLAGRKGICPECGARFRVPLESAVAPAAPAGLPEAAAVASRPPDASAAGGGLAAAPAALSPSGTPVARIVSLDPVLAATLPRAIPLAVAGEPLGGA